MYKPGGLILECVLGRSNYERRTGFLFLCTNTEGLIIVFMCRDKQMKTLYINQ